MDEAYRKHHMWVRPKLRAAAQRVLPPPGLRHASRRTSPGLDLAREHDLVDNFMWANDFPHHEGTWPHSAEAIERTMGSLDDGERAKILGPELARVFRCRSPSAT